MARTLTSPIVRSNIEKKMVTSGKYTIVIDNNGNVDLPRSFYEYEIASLGSDGVPITSQIVVIYVPDMPAAFKTKLKELHNMVISGAESAGYLEAGTDTDDF